MPLWNLYLNLEAHPVLLPVRPLEKLKLTVIPAKLLISKFAAKVTVAVIQLRNSIKVL